MSDALTGKAAVVMTTVHFSWPDKKKPTETLRRNKWKQSRQTCQEEKKVGIFLGPVKGVQAAASHCSALSESGDVVKVVSAHKILKEHTNNDDDHNYKKGKGHR